MPRATIPYNDYKVKAFLDTNIILEGRALAELPWEEIDAEGPIIALVTPTAIKEVDSKKQDGRIGRRAREFNKFIAPVAAGGPPIVIRHSRPRVELALSYAVRIPWNQHDDLDPDDGDSCIVAETLHARDMTDAGKLLVSHDIKPIALAANYDLETKHVSQKWLRSMDPSPADREVQRLKGKLAEYEAKEPAFDIKIEMLDGEPVSVLRIEDLTDAERASIEHTIVADNPEEKQTLGRYSVRSDIVRFDHSYGAKYKAYRNRIPIFMSNYAQRLERLFNQARFRVEVMNTGKMQAEHLLIDVSASSGWIHDQFVWVSPSGPNAPSPRTDHFLPIPQPSIHVVPPPIGRHEFAFKDKPDWRSSFFSVTCEDFRHGEDWAYDAVLGIDPRAPETTITVTVTASNLRGNAQFSKVIERQQETVHVSKVVDLNLLKVIAPTPIDGHLDRERYEEKIDWEAFTIEEEE